MKNLFWRRSRAPCVRQFSISEIVVFCENSPKLSPVLSVKICKQLAMVRGNMRGGRVGMRGSFNKKASFSEFKLKTFFGEF